MSERQTHASGAQAQVSVQAQTGAQTQAGAQAGADDTHAHQRAHAGLGASAGASVGSGVNPASGATSPAAHLATFQLLYESRDGRMCLFQDGQGHLTCVRADRLAH